MILISDFCLTARNRGTAALGYGAISFLREKGYLNSSDVIVLLELTRNPLKKSFYTKNIIQGKKVTFYHLFVNSIEYRLLMAFGLIIPFSRFGKFCKNLKFVASINGGDGFSDIYGDTLFKSRLLYTHLAMKLGVPHILLPQTIGPFEKKCNKEEAHNIIKYSEAIFVRDKKYVKELDDLGVKYELTKDLSAYMQPEAWDISVQTGAVGINISGLAYSNKFGKTAGQFDIYPSLIEVLIRHFQNKGVQVFLIPHAYGFNNPEDFNDDLVATKEVYNKLENKTNVVFINKDLSSPQIKYLISKMSFFCGTRMHANFAAIYTGVPVFGLSYSYKFAGAFEANGLSTEQTFMINNMQESDIPKLVNIIDNFYNLNKLY